MREEEKREGNVFVGGGMMSGGGGGGLQPSNLAYRVQIAFNREFMEENLFTEVSLYPLIG